MQHPRTRALRVISVMWERNRAPRNHFFGEQPARLLAPDRQNPPSPTECSRPTDRPYWIYDISLYLAQQSAARRLLYYCPRRCDTMHTFWCLWLVLALSGACFYGINELPPFSLTRSLDITVLGSQTPECGAFAISSQQELDAQFQNCTAIQYIFIASNYTGSFVLPNTTTWIGGFQTESWMPELGIFEPSSPNLTSVVGEGVTWIDSGLFIGAAPSVVSVTFPNLSHSFTVIIEDLGENVTLDFPSLVSVNDSLTVSCNISRCVLENNCPRRGIGRC